MANLCKMPAPTSRTYVAKQDMKFQTLSEIKHFFGPTPSLLLWKNSLKNPAFPGFFTWERTFGGYSQ